MKTIIIHSPKHGNFNVQIDDNKIDLICIHKWYVSINRNRVYFNNYKLKTSIHRLILGVTDSKIFVDHIDGNTLNNCLSNLRVSDRSQNGANRKPSKSGSSKYLGVSKHCNGWRVQVKKGGIVYKYGTYKTELEAAIIYNKWALFHHGEFANLNPI